MSGGITINLGNTNNSGSSNSFWGYGGTASKIGGALTGLASAGSSAYSTYADVQNAKAYIDKAHSFMFRPQDINDNYEYLKRDYSSWTPLSYFTPKDLGYSTSKGVLNTISSAGAGASAGAAFGGIGAAVGGVLGLGMGLAGLFAGKNKANKETAKLNNAVMDVNDHNNRMFGLRYGNIKDQEEQGLLSSAYTKRGMGYADGGLIQSLNSKVLSPFGNRFDDGGLVLDYLHSNGSDWNNGFTLIGTGGSHEQNPLGGVQTSVDSEGNPNLLEEGEVQYESKDNGTWAYSARREIPKDDAKALGLNWHKGMTFADGMIERQKIAGQMPYDPIEQRGFDAFAMRLAGIQEREKQKEQQRLDNELYTNFAANGGLLDTSNMFSFGGLMQPNILVDAGQVNTWDNKEGNPVYDWWMNYDYDKFLEESFPDKKITGKNGKVWRDWSENPKNKPTKEEFLNRAFTGSAGPAYNSVTAAYNKAQSTPTNSTTVTGNDRIDYINKMSDEEWQRYVDDKGLDTMGVETKQQAIDILNNPDPMVRGALENTIDKTKSATLKEVVVPYNKKWTNLGKSTRKYDKDKKAIEYSWEKNGLAHKDVRTHLKNTLLGGPQEKVEQWIQQERQKAIDEYLKENPNDKKLENFVDPTKDYEIYSSSYGIPEGQVTWTYEPNNLTEEQRKEYTSQYKDNNYANSKFTNGIYTDLEGNEITPEVAATLNEDEYNWRPATALELLTDPVTKEIRYDTALGEDILGKYKYDFTSTNSRVKPEEPAKMPGVGLSPLRYWPIVDSAVQLGQDLFGDTNVIDFTNTNMLRNKLSSLDVPAYQEMQDFISPLPFARDYYTNQALAQAAADRRGILGNVGGNRGAATQALLTQDQNVLNKLGDLGRAGQEYNRQDYLKVRDYNRQSKQFDADQTMKYNQMRLDAAKQQWDDLFKTVTMDDAMLNQVSQNRSTNRSNFASNVQGLGEDAHNQRMLQMLINSGYFGTTLDQAYRNYRQDYADWIAGQKNKNNQPNITIIKAQGGEIKTKRRKKHLTY